MSIVNDNDTRTVGLSPGSLVYTGNHPGEQSVMRLIEYDEHCLEEREVETTDEACLYLKSDPITWINVEGLTDIDLIRRLGECFGLHPLVLEDILHPHQRPKIETYDGYLFLVLHMISLPPGEHDLVWEQVSLVIGPNFVVSFQEKGGDVFDGVRNRIRSGKGRIRRLGADYLGYALLDAVVDNYFLVLEAVGDELEALEEELIEKPGPQTLAKIYRLKRETLVLRRSVWPLRDVTNTLVREESELLTPDVQLFFRDVYDHTIQVIETTETLRDMVAGMLDVYLSSISIKTNEVMKVLTIMSSIFIPLTFIAGVYGMNFDYMPELHSPDGYPLVWAVMIAVAIGQVIYFRRRGWL